MSYSFVKTAASCTGTDLCTESVTGEGQCLCSAVCGKAATTAVDAYSCLMDDGVMREADVSVCVENLGQSLPASSTTCCEATKECESFADCEGDMSCRREVVMQAFDVCRNETYRAMMNASRAECLAAELGWTTAQVIGAIVAVVAGTFLVLVLVCCIFCKIEHQFCHPEHWLWNHSCGKAIHAFCECFHPGAGWGGEQDGDDAKTGDVEGGDAKPAAEQSAEHTKEEEPTASAAAEVSHPALLQLIVSLTVPYDNGRCRQEAREARLAEMKSEARP